MVERKVDQDVIVVGAGVIGLLSAYRLAQAGKSVLLLESAAVGSEASWAGGGIVSPLYPWRYSPAVTALAHWSQDFYPQLGQRLLAETGVDPEVHVTGLYWLDLDDEAPSAGVGRAPWAALAFGTDERGARGGAVAGRRLFSCGVHARRGECA